MHGIQSTKETRARALLVMIEKGLTAFKTDRLQTEISVSGVGGPGGGGGSDIGSSGNSHGTADDITHNFATLSLESTTRGPPVRSMRPKSPEVDLLDCASDPWETIVQKHANDAVN
jgi:hypothetical protein